MASYHVFQVGRTTRPFVFRTLILLRQVDASIGLISFEHPVWVLKKTTPWGSTTITAVQNVLETAPVETPQLLAQADVDRLSNMFRALVEVLVDEINILRGLLALTPRTLAQAIQAIRNKFN